jgi:hypothetical protein
MLEVCDSRRIALHSSVRRGIFWQDLNTAMMTGTDRVLSRSAFPEFRWGGETFKVPWSRLPSGFEVIRDVLGGFTRVLQDIYVLQIRGECIGKPHKDLESIHDMDNQQACIESRLHDWLQLSKENSLQTAILLAAYLYTYSLFVQVWNGSIIPLHLSTTLLSKLQWLTQDDSWAYYEPILLWCTIIGGCLSPAGSTRSGYTTFFRRRFLSTGRNIASSWAAVEQALGSLLWSHKLFDARGITFWEECVTH